MAKLSVSSDSTSGLIVVSPFNCQKFLPADITRAGKIKPDDIRHPEPDPFETVTVETRIVVIDDGAQSRAVCTDNDIFIPMCGQYLIQSLNIPLLDTGKALAARFAEAEILPALLNHFNGVSVLACLPLPQPLIGMDLFIQNSGAVRYCIDSSLIRAGVKAVYLHSGKDLHNLVPVSPLGFRLRLCPVILPRYIGLCVPGEKHLCHTRPPSF